LKEAKTGPALIGAAGVGGTGEGGTGEGGTGEGGAVGVSVGPETTVEMAVGVGWLVSETSLQAPISSETTNEMISKKLVRRFFFLMRFASHLFVKDIFSLAKISQKVNYYRLPVGSLECD
jgi:hypothetical protein